MTANEKLTRYEALLVQRYFDGECDDQQSREARLLLKESAGARLYLTVLETLQAAVHQAEDYAWENADAASPAEVLQMVEASADLEEVSLEALAPVLERYHDGEVDPAEAAVVETLMERREDVATYLKELQELSLGVREVEQKIEDVDFDGFWEGISEQIDEFENQQTAPLPAASGPFDPFQHRQLLYRYHDGEATETERRRVEAWLESQDEQVEATLSALEEVAVGVEAALDEAVDQTEVDDIWEGVEQQLDAIDAERAAENVVSLNERDDDERSQVWGKPMLAVAAAVALLATGALFGSHLLGIGSQPVETETVVIFDSVESAPGSSVMIHSPEFADHDVNGTIDYEAAANEGVEPTIRAEDDEADPTVLWVIDDDDDDDDDERSPEDQTDELPGPI